MNKIAGFEIDIVDYDAKHLVGFTTRSNIARATIDCPPLWEKLYSRLDRFSGRTRNETYGLFLMVDDFISFDFWVAVATPANFKISRDMEVFELDAGQYVRCRVPNNAELLMAYGAIYSTWYHGQEEYDIVKRGPCFELYPPRWKPTDPLELYVRIVPRNKS